MAGKVKLTDLQLRRKVKSIYRRWMEDELFFDELASDPDREFSDVTEVLRNLGSAIASAQAMGTGRALLSSSGKDD